MTQLFDPETGVVTSVTVIAGRPVPGRAGEDGRDRRLRRRPARVRRRRRAQAHAARARAPEALRRRRRTASSSSSAAPIDGAVEGETVTVEDFQPGDAIKVAGIGIGKGFQGTIKRHNFSSGPRSHGSHNIRKPGSIGASATPSRVFKGIKMAGRMGGKRVTQVGLTVHEVDVERNLLLVKGSVPGPKNGHRRGARLMAAPTAPLLDAAGAKAKDVSLEEAVFAVEVKPHLVHEAVRAELNAHRAGTFATKSRGLVSGGRAKPWRQKGTGRARARARSAPPQFRAAATPSRRCRARSSRRSTARRPRPRSARRSRAMRRRARSRSSTRRRSRSRRRKLAQSFLESVWPGRADRASS